MDEYDKKILNFLKEEYPRGLTIKQLKKKTGYSLVTVSRRIEILKLMKKIEQQDVGPAKLNFWKEDDNRKRI